jgi:Rrf2 family protein
MKISSIEEYGLRCMLQLAAQPDGEPLTLTQIADREGLSLAYAGKLMGLLRDQGLVESVRGRGGGYVLPRPASQITLRQILVPMGGLIVEEDFCTKHSGSEDACVHVGTSCTIHSLWGVLQTLLDDVLDRTTLAELMTGEAMLRMLEARPPRRETRFEVGDEGLATGRAKPA